MGTAFPASASAGRYFFSSAAVNDRSSDRRCVMSRASARSRSEPLASSTPRVSSCRTKSSNRSEASASRKVKRLYPMSLTRVSLTQHPGLTQRDRARFQRDLDRSGLERTQRGIGFGRTAELNSCQKNQPDQMGQPRGALLPCHAAYHAPEKAEQRGGFSRDTRSLAEARSSSKPRIQPSAGEKPPHSYPATATFFSWFCPFMSS